MDQEEKLKLRLPNWKRKKRISYTGWSRTIQISTCIFNKVYGSEKSEKIKHAESFEICEVWKTTTDERN